MKQVLIIASLLIINLWAQGQQDEYPKVINWLKENRIELNNPVAPKGYQKFYDCDSNVVFKKMSGDTIKFFIGSSVQSINLSQLAEFQKCPCFNIMAYPEEVDKSGAISMRKLEPETFLVKNDTLYKVDNRLNEFVSNLSDLKEAFGNYPDSLKGISGFMQKILSPLAEAMNLKNLTDTDRTRPGKNLSYLSLLFYNGMFNDSGSVGTHIPVFLPTIGEVIVNERIDLLKKWEVNSETYYCVNVTCENCQGENTVLFTSRYRFPHLENCEVNKDVVVRALHHEIDSIAQWRSDSTYNARRKPATAAARMGVKVNTPDSFFVVSVKRKTGLIDKEGDEVIPIKYQSDFSYYEGRAAVGNSEDKWGFIDEYGKEITPMQYDIAANFSGGLGAIQKKGFWGFINKDGKEVIACKYARVLYPFSGGLAAVELNEHAGFIDEKGKEVIAIKYDEVFPFAGGLAKVKLNSHYGFINYHGEEVIGIKYDDVSHYLKDGLVVAKLNNKVALINEAGKELTTFRYDGIDTFLNGRASVYLGDKHGLIDQAGKEVVPVIYNTLMKPRNGMVIAARDGRYGILDNAGKEILPLSYDWVDYYSDELFIVVLGGKSAIAGKNGKIIIPFKYSDMRPCTDGFVLVRNAFKRCGLIDLNGKEILPLKYNDIDDRFTAGLVVVELAGKMGYFNKAGRLVIPFKYDKANPFFNGIAEVTLSNKSGFIDTLGNEIIPCRYDMVMRAPNNLITVYNNRKVGFLTTKGKEVLPLIYDQVADIVNGLFPVKFGGKWGVLNMAGKEVIPFLYDSIWPFGAHDELR